MRNYFIYKSSLIIILASVLFSCKDYETGGGITSTEPIWRVQLSACSMSESKFVIPQTGQVGEYLFDLEKDMNINSETYNYYRWTRNTQGACSEDVNTQASWEKQGTLCSVSTQWYVQPEEGKTGTYAFNYYKDINPVSATFNAVIWERNTESDGTCTSGSGESKDPIWEVKGSICSVNADKFVQPDEGATGSFGFNILEDTNPESSSFGSKKYERNASLDGVCQGIGSINITPMKAPPGMYTSFITYNNRIFVTEQIKGVYELINGEWVVPKGLEELNDDIFYAKMAVGANNKLFISCAKGALYQSGDDVYHKAYWKNDNKDMAGGLGGSNTHFFLSAGANFGGIFQFNGSTFEPTNMSNGCYYSIVALNENEVFFGSYEKSNGIAYLENRFGVRRYNGSSVVETNLKSGAYDLVRFNNEIYAIGDKIYKWTGSQFNEIFNQNGALRVTGNTLYLLSGNGTFKFNGSTFTSFADGGHSDIVEHNGVIYLIGYKGIKFYLNNVWTDIPNINGSKGLSTPSGLYISSENQIVKIAS